MLKKSHHVILWTFILCFMVILMVVIGGVTRLTGSGLSMVEWKPLMGAIPPLTHQDWLEVFARYQTSPQYQLVNQGMSLSEFQWIFFWEYFHRLVGRLMAVVFLIPWAWFWIKGYFNKTWALRFLVGFLLGGLQGVMGWVMVASGLVDQPQVSHFRLAAHLLLAFFILAYFWRLIWKMYTEERRMVVTSSVFSSTTVASLPSTSMMNSSIEKDKAKTFLFITSGLNVLLVILILQIMYGAFVAGLRAGFIANTFPDMDGHFYPLGGWSLTPAWKNIFENPLSVQWVHRLLGWGLLLGSLWLYLKARFQKEWALSPYLQRQLLGLVLVIFTQFSFGVLTLLLKVPLPLAVLHQVGATAVLLYLLWLRWQFHGDGVQHVHFIN